MSETQNVDPAEIEKFESIANHWWDPDSEFKPLHDMNPLRLDYIEGKTSLPGKRVVDIGCGGGILSESMAKNGAKVTGLDMGATPLMVAKLHAADGGLEIDYKQQTAEDLAESESGNFDVVTCMEMLEHVPDPSSIVNACSLLTKPGGDVFFSTISRTAKAWLMAIVGAEYVLNLLPRGTHHYENFIRPSELNRWCRKSGLEVQEITGVHYNPISKRFSLAPAVDVNYIVHCVKQ